jgi:hypothetical protein
MTGVLRICLAERNSKPAFGYRNRLSSRTGIEDFLAAC